MANGTFDTVKDSTLIAANTVYIPVAAGKIGTLSNCVITAPTARCIQSVGGTIDVVEDCTMTVVAGGNPVIDLSGATTIGAISGGSVENNGTSYAMNIIGTSAVGSISGTAENPIEISTNGVYGVYITADASVGAIDYANISGQYGLNTESTKVPGINMTVKNSTITGTNNHGLVAKGKMAELSNCKIVGKSYGVTVETANGNIGVISNCNITGANGILVNNAASEIGEIRDSVLTAQSVSCILSAGKIGNIIGSPMTSQSGNSSVVSLNTTGSITSIDGGSPIVHEGTGSGIGMSGTSTIGSIGVKPVTPTEIPMKISVGGIGINMSGTAKIGAIIGTAENPIEISTKGGYGMYIDGSAEIGSIDYANVSGNIGIYTLAKTTISEIKNSTITGKVSYGLQVRSTINKLTNCKVTGEDKNHGLVMELTGRIDTIDSCIITADAYGIYMAGTSSIGEIKGETTQVTAFNRVKDARGNAIYLVENAKIEKISDGVFTGTNSKTDGAGTGYAVYLSTAGSVIGAIEGGKFIVNVSLPEGTTFTGKNYALYNRGTVQVGGTADLTGAGGDALYAGIGNYHTGKLSVTGGKIGDARCEYGIFNDQFDTTYIPTLSIGGGEIVGGVTGVQNEGDILSVTGGTITGGEYGIYNDGLITELGGTVVVTSKAKFGVNNGGTITALTGGTFAGTQAGIYVGSGTVGSIRGSVGIAAPYGVVYGGTLSNMPSGFDNSTGVISGATTHSDAEANYKDYGIEPTIRGGNLFANGMDIDVDYKDTVAKTGVSVTWTNPVLGKQTRDSGFSNIYGGGDGYKLDVGGENIGKTVITTPNDGKDTTININGGTCNAIYAGGMGNTHFDGKVVMNVKGGVFTSIYGGGEFGNWQWGYKDFGRGWAVVDEVEMNLLGAVKIGFFIGLGGNANAWVDKATANISVQHTGALWGTSSRFHVNGDSNVVDTVPRDKFHEEVGMELPNSNSEHVDMEVGAMADLIKKACLGADGKTPRPDGVGTVVMDATVNYKNNINTSRTLSGGNIGGYPNSYTDNLKVNIEEGSTLYLLQIGGNRGHVESTTVSVNGTLNSLDTQYYGSCKNLNVNVANTGKIGTAITLGKAYASSDKDRGWNGGMAGGGSIVIKNDSEKYLYVEMQGATVADSMDITGKVKTYAAPTSVDTRQYFGFIRPDTRYALDNFYWTANALNSQDNPYGFGQKGYLLVRGDMVNTSRSADPNKKGGDFEIEKDGHLYIYESKLKEADITEDLKGKLEKNGNTVVLGELVRYGGTYAEDPSTIPNGIVNTMSLDEVLAKPTPFSAVKDAQGEYKVYAKDKDGIALGGTAEKEWDFLFAPKGEFEPNPAKYLRLDQLVDLSDGVELQFMSTRKGVSFFGTCTLSLTQVEKTLTYDLTGGTAEGLNPTQKIMGEKGWLTDIVPTKADAEFIGWNTAMDGSGTLYKPGASIILAGDITLYATWRTMGKVIVTVLDHNDKSVGNMQVTIKDGATRTLLNDTTDAITGIVTASGLPCGSYQLQVGVYPSWRHTQTITIKQGTTEVTVRAPEGAFDTMVDANDILNSADNLENSVTEEQKNEWLESTGEGKNYEGVLMLLHEEKYLDVQSGNKIEDVIKAAANGASFEDFIELTLTRYFYKANSAGDEVRQAGLSIDKSENPLTLRFQISDALYQSLADKELTTDEIVIYRYEKDKDSGVENVVALNKVNPNSRSTAPADSYWIETQSGVSYIAVNADKFSVYGFGYKDTLPITVIAAENGVVKANRNSAPEGANIILTPEPMPGYKVGEIVATDESGNILPLTKQSDGTYTFVMPQSAVTVTPSFVKSGSGVSTYIVRVNDAKNGTATASHLIAPAGASVSVTLKADYGYSLTTLSITAENGGSISYTENYGAYTFIMPSSNVSISAIFDKNSGTDDFPFIDVGEDHWARGDIEWAYENDYMKGTSDTTFSPGLSTTRGMVATIVWRMENKPKATQGLTFDDVKTGLYYSDAVAWAAENIIVKGYGNGNYGPEDIVTREQLAAILYRYAEFKGYDVTAKGDLTQFSDTPSEWAFEDVVWAVGEQLLKGKGGEILDPRGDTTRAELATILRRFCEYAQR